MKFGIIFYSVLGIIALLIGIYLLNKLSILSVIFFIGAFVNGVFIYKEYNIHKNNKVIYDENTIPQEIIIKYSLPGKIVSISTYSIFIIVGFLFLSSIIIKFNFASILFLTIISGFTIFFIVKVILAIKIIPKIIISINDKGIQLKDNPRFLWSEIQLEKIISKHLKNPDSRHDYKAEINYLYFFHNNEKIEIKIDDFDITDYQLAQALKIYRVRYNNKN